MSVYLLTMSFFSQKLLSKYQHFDKNKDEERIKAYPKRQQIK